MHNVDNALCYCTKLWSPYKSGFLDLPTPLGGTWQLSPKNPFFANSEDIAN